MAMKSRLPGASLESEQPEDAANVLDEFTLAWEQGRDPVVEEYLDRLDPSDSRSAVELIYREFCLAEADGCQRDVSLFLDRFPHHKPALERLMRLHGECPPSLLDRWMATAPALDTLPDVGDSIGPYLLRRELGRGGFSRVFLAEQTNLENRLVVLKLSTRSTREPWLLARVRHAHIVEILTHARVDDDAFQMLCMPFWGGATLADVLTARRKTGNRPVSGLDLLTDLDSVAAPEFPTVQAARPARELLAGLSYSQAIAWIGARLAEALDHAFSREVAHGDVKPSNILLSADGNPLLLDFNLARDSSPASVSQSIADPGGTIAYMSPERLLRLMSDGHADRDDVLERTQETERGAHQADLYALGMVLLEALTGQPPATITVGGELAASTDSGRLRSMAAAYASARSAGARAMLRKAESDTRVAIAPGLRAILERCLDPDPAQRYQRGLELAEDLDRWRADRPLIGASEPFWGQTVPRIMRRQRRAILVAALSVCIITATTGVALFKSQQTLRTLAVHKVSRLWDDPEARAYHFQRTNFPRLLEPDESRVETAAHALKEYDVLGPDDWRRREDVRNLPHAERKDLELWLMEQVYLYCRALADRPESPGDWSRAMKLIDHVDARIPIPAFAALRHRLITQLAVEPPIRAAITAGSAPARQPFWGNEYLLGVVAECELDSADPDIAAALEKSDRGRTGREFAVCQRDGRIERAAARALAHYNRFLGSHPDSFWGHYRAAAVSYGLGGRANLAAAAGHLESCLQRRPDNPMLHNHLAASLISIDRHHEAQHEIEIAIEQAPDLAEFYRTRARLRTILGQTGALADDLRHFELLSNVLPRRLWGYSTAVLDQSPTDDITTGFRALPSSFTFAGRGDSTSSDRTFAEIDPEELVDRADLAIALRKAGEPELAAAELGKVLILDPNHIGARMTRATQAIEAWQLDEALLDIEAVIDHPRLLEYLRDEPRVLAHFRQADHPSLISILQIASRRYCATGRIADGKRIARRAVQLATALEQPAGESHYNLARAHVMGELHAGNINRAANQLFRAFVAHPDYKQHYASDKVFDPVRKRIDAILANKPDPSAEHHRRLAAIAPQKGR